MNAAHSTCTKRFVVQPVFLSAALAQAATRYVALNGGHVSPFTNGWASAATNIQAAVNVAAPGDTVLVQTGMYRTAAEITVDRAVTLASVAGAAKTIVTPKPYTYVGGFYLGSNNCILTGFTISNCSAVRGGGVSCLSTNPVIAQCVIIANHGGAFGGGVLSNCVIAGNRANMTAGMLGTVAYDSLIASNVSTLGHGGMSGGRCARCRLVANVSSNSNYAGGAAGATLLNCLLIRNTAVSGYGGASACALVNCTVAHNSGNPGGIGGGYLTNSIVYENTAPSTISICRRIRVVARQVRMPMRPCRGIWTGNRASKAGTSTWAAMKPCPNQERCWRSWSWQCAICAGRIRRRRKQ